MVRQNKSYDAAPKARGDPSHVRGIRLTLV